MTFRPRHIPLDTFHAQEEREEAGQEIEEKSDESIRDQLPRRIARWGSRRSPTFYPVCFLRDFPARL